jgi:GT2 family glycosyltransferase
MPATEPSIEIVIPNWNGADMLGHCLDSLACQRYQDFRVTVVDNGSTDHSIEIVEKKYPHVRLIRFTHNSGFSVAVNRGIEGSSAPWILLLNNDMEVDPGCLDALAKGVAAYPDCDFFALKMVSYHQRQMIDGAGDAVLRGGAGYRIGTMEEDGERFQKDRPCFGACAGAALYSRKFFNDTGLFDIDFFAYLEDVDLNIRARRLGLKCYFLSRAVVFHIGSASSGSKINALTVRLSTRNSINMLVKNYPLSLWLRFLPAIVVYQLMWLLFCLKKTMFAAYWKGLFQALRMVPIFLEKRRKMYAQLPGSVCRELGDMISAAEREAVESIMARRQASGKGNGLLRLYCKIFF